MKICEPRMTLCRGREVQHQARSVRLDPCQSAWLVTVVRVLPVLAYQICVWRSHRFGDVVTWTHSFFSGFASTSNSQTVHVARRIMSNSGTALEQQSAARNTGGTAGTEPEPLKRYRGARSNMGIPVQQRGHLQQGINQNTCAQDLEQRCDALLARTLVRF